MNINFKSASFRGAEAITPSDVNNLSTPISAIYIGTTGTLKVITASDETVTFTSVPVGVLNVAIKKVFNTGTSASGLIGLK